MELHHLGYVVKCINDFEKNLIFREKVKETVDIFQNSKLALYKNHSNSFIELIEPINRKSFSWNSLIKFGNHFNHVCYKVEDNKELDIIVKSKRLIKVLGPVPATLFDNKYVCFYFDRNKQLL